MLALLILLLTILPLAELALLVYIGRHTSVLFTLGLVIATGWMGALLARWQGLRALRRIGEDLDAGRAPAESVIDSILIFIAGVMLIAPGVITDAVGFALMIPPVRRLVSRWVSWSIRRNIQTRFVVTDRNPFHARGVPDGEEVDDAIDVEIVRNEPQLRPPSKG